MLNFLGLGFSMGAQDKGLAASLKNTTAGLMDISKSVVGIGMASAKMAFKPPNFGPSVALAQSLANDVKLTTTATEAFGIASSKVTAAGLAGLDLTDKQLSKAKSKISGIAYSTNMDIGSLTKSFSSLTQAGIDTNKMSEYGFSNFTEFSKVMEVTGADAGQMASAMGTMTKQMGMNKAQVKDSITAVAAIGRKFNIGREAVAGMSDTVKILNENSNLLPQNWSPARMNKFLKGTTVVAGALTSIGFTADEAMTASKSLTKGLLAGQAGMADLYSGVKNELPAAFSVMTENFGDADKAFAMLQESPDQFMLKMGDMVDKVNKMDLKPEAMNRFRSQMQGTFGPEIMAVFNKKGFGTLKPALEKASDAMKDQGTVIKTLAKGYEDGFLPSEKFARAQDQMHYKLKKVKGVMSDGEYLKKYKENTDQVVSTVSDLAAKGGILGKATTMFVEFSNHGVGGALAAHTKWGLAMSEGMKLMEPMMQYLPAMGAAFKALSSPIGMVVGGMGALYFLFKDLDKGKNSIAGPMLKKFIAEAPEFIKKIGGFAKDMFSTMYSVLSKVDWDSVFKTVTDAAFTVFSAIGDVIASVNWGKVFEVVSSVISKVINVVFDVLGKINWAGIAESVSNAFKMIFSTIFAVIEKIDWNKVGQVLGVILSKAAEIAVDLLGAAFKLGEKLLMWLDGIDWGGMGKKIGGYLMDALAIIYTAVLRVVENLPEMIMKVFQKASDFILGIFDGVRDWFMKKFPDAAGPIFVAFETIKTIIAIIIKVAGAAFAFIGGLIKEYVQNVKDTLSFIGDIGNAIIGVFTSEDDNMFDQLQRSAYGLDKTVTDTGGTFGGVMADMAKKQLEVVAASKKRHEEWVAGEHAAGRATEGFVKTLEGTILASTQTFSRYEKDAMGTLVKVSHDASKFIRGQISGDLAKQFNDMQQDIIDTNAARKSMGLKGEELSKQMDQDLAKSDKLHADFLKNTGMRWDLVYAARERVLDQYRLEDTAIASAKAQGAGYYSALTGYQAKLSEQSLAVEGSLIKLKTAGKELTLEYIQGSIKLALLNAENKKRMDGFKDLMAGDISKSFDPYVSGAKTAMAALEAAGKKGSEEYIKIAEQQEARTKAAELTAHAFFEVNKAQAAELVAKIPEAMGKTRDQVQGMMDQIAQAQKADLYDFLQHTTLKGDALNKEVARRREKYHSMAYDVERAVASSNEQLLIGSDTGITKLLGNLQTGLTKMTQEVATKTQENATEIQKSFAVTGDTALNSVKEIGAIDPTRFRKNMAAVQSSFMGFLAVMDAKGKTLMTNTNKSFDTMWTTMSTGWARNQKVLEDFSVSADKFFTKFWQMLVDKATKFAGDIIDVTKNIETSLSSMSKSINLMDLLASPDQINQWAASVVSALSYAFMDGKAADAMISASYNRALMMAGEFAKTGAATPESITASQPSPNASATSSAAMQATLNLVNAIHDPKWANDPKKPIPLALAEMNKNLENALLAMKGVAESRATASRATSKTRPTR